MANYAVLNFSELRVSDLMGNDQAENAEEFKIWMCIICGWMYEEEKGAPEEGIAPGTRWEDIPDDWYCPDCGASKEEFEMIEV